MSYSFFKNYKLSFNKLHPSDKFGIQSPIGFQLLTLFCLYIRYLQNTNSNTKLSKGVQSRVGVMISLLATLILIQSRKKTQMMLIFLIFTIRLKESVLDFYCFIFSFLFLWVELVAVLMLYVFGLSN